MVFVFPYPMSWHHLLNQSSDWSGTHFGLDDWGRFGLLFARRGMWGDERLLSEEWIDKAKAPSDPNPSYGYMWWTLKGNTQWEGVPDHVYYAAGFGGNYIIIDEENDLVVVLRWIDNTALGEFMTQLYQSIRH